MITKNPNLPGGFKSKYNGINIKIAIKEKKADKRKEKSRVAAQIRRNKESQTLILLQNALPIDLPSPNRILEKSIVIRIAGQTLFLMNNLDQVLGMSGCLTVSLISSNFLAIFTNSIGQIVYVSPNFQTILDQQHWSNLIGISLFDIMDFKSKWPVTGDVIKLRLLSNPHSSCDCKPSEPQVSSMSFSTSLSYPNYTRSTIASKINSRSNPSIVNHYSSPSSIYSVWCSTNINHTNSKLRLLLLRQIQLQPGSSTTNSVLDKSKCQLVSNNDIILFERSLSAPLYFSEIMSEPSDPGLHQLNEEKGSIQKCFLVSIHDRKYNFESISSEFIDILGIQENLLTGQSLLNVIHVDDVIKVKSYLDSFVERRDKNYLWTQIYRIICNDGRCCFLQTLAKPFSSSCFQTIVLHHRIIRTGVACEYSTKYGACELKKKSFGIPKKPLIGSPNIKSKSIPKPPGTRIVYQRPTHLLSVEQGFLNEQLPKVYKMDDNVQNLLKSSFKERESYFQLVKPRVVSINKNELDSTNSSVEEDPLLPTCFNGRTMIYNKPKEINIKTCISKSICIDKIKLSPELIQTNRFENELNCNVSCCFENCVLTSPSPDSGISINDQFIWDYPDNLNDLTEPNQWFDEYQNDLELINSI